MTLIAVHLEVAVHDSLPRLRTCFRESGAANHIVQAPFAHDQQLFARVALLAACLFEVTSQLSLSEAVVMFDLLLLHQGLTVVRRPTDTRSHSRRVLTTLESANGPRAFVNHRTQTAIDPRLCAVVPSHKRESPCFSKQSTVPSCLCPKASTHTSNSTQPTINLWGRV